MSYHGKKQIVESRPGYYRLEGDNFWYRIVIGPGPDIPMINVGPGSHPDPPTVFGPGENGGYLDDDKALEKLLKATDDKEDVEKVEKIIKRCLDEKKPEKK
jgi:hypothetical protein